MSCEVKHTYINKIIIEVYQSYKYSENCDNVIVIFATAYYSISDAMYKQK